MARYAVKDISLRIRCARRECATACPLRARSALRCGLLKIGVWDTLRHCVGEDSDAVARRPDRLPKTLNGVEWHGVLLAQSMTRRHQIMSSLRWDRCGGREQVPQIPSTSRRWPDIRNPCLAAIVSSTSEIISLGNSIISPHFLQIR